jgi:uncharacterized membrane protein
VSVLRSEGRDPVVERVSTLLGAGTLAIVLAVAIGTLLVVVAGRTPVAEHGPTLDIARIPGDLVALRPDGWLWLGLLLTVTLPIARVVLALVGFVRSGERRLAVVSVATLSVLALSIAIALMTS